MEMIHVKDWQKGHAVHAAVLSIGETPSERFNKAFLLYDENHHRW